VKYFEDATGLKQSANENQKVDDRREHLGSLAEVGTSVYFDSVLGMQTNKCVH
jgi:hypothetical protein